MSINKKRARYRKRRRNFEFWKSISKELKNLGFLLSCRRF